MGPLKTVVRSGRDVLMENRLEYPVGLELNICSPVDGLEEDELQSLDTAREASERERQATG